MDEKEELRKINEQVFVDEIADVSEEVRQAAAKLMADRLCDEIADAYDLAGEDITTGADNDSVGDDEPIDTPTVEDLSANVQEEPQELERVTAPSVKSSAAKVAFTCGTWTAKKTDKKGTKQVEQINQVKNVGEFKKSLMSDNLALKQLKYYSGKARNKHYEMTMAFGGNNE